MLKTKEFEQCVSRVETARELLYAFESTDGDSMLARQHQLDRLSPAAERRILQALKEYKITEPIADLILDDFHGCRENLAALSRASRLDPGRATQDEIYSGIVSAAAVLRDLMERSDQWVHHVTNPRPDVDPRLDSNTFAEYARSVASKFDSNVPQTSHERDAAVHKVVSHYRAALDAPKGADEAQYSGSEAKDKTRKRAILDVVVVLNRFEKYCDGSDPVRSNNRLIHGLSEAEIIALENSLIDSRAGISDINSKEERKHIKPRDELAKALLSGLNVGDSDAKIRDARAQLKDEGLV